MFAFLGFLVATALHVSAARPSAPTVSTIGNDISWPQCGKRLPTGQAFGIVGVNGGLANTTNPCLAEQLKWAKNSTGSTIQPKIQLYVNTANPGGLGTPSWPKNNIDPAGNNAPNPHGTCNGSDSLACAWQYGWNRAVEDVIIRFNPAAPVAGVDTNPAKYVWWLDVETENTWKTGSSGFASNVADLEGMVAYFKGSLGAKVGIYSTGYQWGQIVGGAVGPNSNLNGLDSWLAGALSEKAARNNCKLAPLTTGAKVTLTQYVSKNLDYNVSCV